MGGYCASWCGEGNGCCKKGFGGDPAPCQTAVGFTGEHHECVRLSSGTLPVDWPLSYFVAIGCAWVIVCVGAYQLFGGGPRKPKHVVVGAPLEGEVDVHWKRR